MIHKIKTEIIGLMACDPRGVVGLGGKIPWHHKEDIVHFNNLVEGQIIIMGRKTYENIPHKVLLNCTFCIVFSRSKEMQKLNNIKLKIVDSLGSFSALLNNIERYILIDRRRAEDLRIFMIGGAIIANLFLKNGLIAEFFLTKIHHQYDGDKKLNLKFFNGWKEERIEDFGYCSIWHLIKNAI